MRIFKRQPIAFIILLGLFGGGEWLKSGCGAGEDKAGEKKADGSKEAIVLPKDPKTVVLSYDPGAGGFVRKGPPPYLQIQADGKVTLTNLFDGSKKESKLTAKELDELLRFVIREKDFFAITEAKINGAIREAAAKGPFVAIGGAGTSVISVQANGKKHEVSYRGASAYLGVYPKVEVLARFVAIEKRLSELAESVAKAK